jgi:hypothetical protein
VIDQFEEFLILHTEEKRSAFVRFLDDLVKNPIEGLRLLLVFRSDYRPLVFKLDLPLLVAGQNWQELAPYSRGEATLFLQGGGRKLSPEALNELFLGLDQIEETRGLYRPITLNMVGLVLQRMGGRLEGDPARLIQSYLTTCLTESQSRDFAKPVLATMITDAGTKVPRTEADLVISTGFEPWQIKATLSDLAQQGLVRRLEGAVPVWEIAHDFLARIIGQLIGRLKPTFVSRAQPLVAPIVLLGWIAIAVLAVPGWLTLQEVSSENALKATKASLSINAFGAAVVRFSDDLEDSTFSKLRTHLERINPEELDLSYATGITSLEPLKGLANLKHLNLSYTTITSIEPLKGLTNLTRLDLSGATGIMSLEPLKGLTNLARLDLSGATGITSLEPLKGLTNLARLDLKRATGVRSLEPLKGLANLTQLDFSDASGITSLEPLKGLTNLTQLDLSYPNAILTSLEPLKGLTNLTRLDLNGATGITSLEPLKDNKGVTILNVSDELLATMK